MASSISTSTVVLCSLPSSSSKLALSAVSSSTISHPKSIHFHLSPLFSPLNRGLFLPWNGLKHAGISKRPNSLHIGRKSRCMGKVIYASLFGVGAPEALVIGVVALLVFGPKGLAEVARNLGKTLRAFQPTIRELQEVSREFKSTLEREIGLDDISSPRQNTYNSSLPDISPTPPSTASTDNSNSVVDPNGAAGSDRAYSSEEYLKITEEQLRASAEFAQWERQTTPPGEGHIEPQTQPPATEASSTVSPLQKPGNET